MYICLSMLHDLCLCDALFTDVSALFLYLSLVGFVVIVVLSLTLRMPRYRCVRVVFDYPCVVIVCKREKVKHMHNP